MPQGGLGGGYDARHHARARVNTVGARPGFPLSRTCLLDLERLFWEATARRWLLWSPRVYALMGPSRRSFVTLHLPCSSCV